MPRTREQQERYNANKRDRRVASNPAPGRPDIITLETAELREQLRWFREQNNRLLDTVARQTGILAEMQRRIDGYVATSSHGVATSSRLQGPGSVSGRPENPGTPGALRASDSRLDLSPLPLVCSIIPEGQGDVEASQDLARERAGGLEAEIDAVFDPAKTSIHGDGYVATSSHGYGYRKSGTRVPGNFGHVEIDAPAPEAESGELADSPEVAAAESGERLAPFSRRFPPVFDEALVNAERARQLAALAALEGKTR